MEVLNSKKVHDWNDINLITKLIIAAKQSENNFEVDFFQTNKKICVW